MRLIFHGRLVELFGAEVSIEADTVLSAIEGFSRQVEWPKDFPIDIVGFDTEDKLKTHADLVHVMPSMGGGGGKFGTIILGLVEIGVSFIPGIGTAAAVALRIGGALLIAQGVVSLFLKAPAIKSVNDPEASKYLPVNKNTTAVGTPITMAWGRIDLAGQWLSLQSDSTNLAYGTFPANPT